MLWAITSYFNPLGSEVRYQNFQVYRRHMNVPLIVVEHALDGRFDLDESDADLIIRVRGGDLMWQKERLLNIGMRHLPADCTQVVWIDADVVFENPHWTDQLSEMLREYPLVQPFEWVVESTELMTVPAAIVEGDRSSQRRALVPMVLEGVVGLNVFQATGCSLEYGYSPGHVWAARREVIEQCGLYDQLILGAGDKALVAAAFGYYEHIRGALSMADLHYHHYQQWAGRFHSIICGRIGYLKGTIIHLRHGALKMRGYASRYKGFNQFNFDPQRDLHAEPDQPWSLRNGNAQMRQYIRNYFLSREMSES